MLSNTNWYIASLLVSRGLAGGNLSSARRCQYLIEAPNHDEAYERALEVGGRSPADGEQFVGIADLLLVHERPEDGAEILWSESEMTDAEIRADLLRKEDMRAFRDNSSATGWYIASIIVREVHDEGSHGALWLVWINVYLIRALAPDDAYEKVVRIGRGQQDKPGSHQCDGEKAHWEFAGVRDIIPACEVPGPESLLWCDELAGNADQFSSMIPSKSALTVFTWEAEQVRPRG